MNIVILDAVTLGADIDLSPLYALGAVTVYENTKQEEIPARLATADVVVVNKLKMNRGSLQGATALKLIAETATGYDNIDLAYCRQQGIAVCNVPAYSTDSVAGVALAMAFSLAHHLFAYRSHVTSGAYTREGKANCLIPAFHELSSLTFGVIGGGKIARKVATVAKTMGCRVLMCRRQPETEFEAVNLQALCREADIISVHVPLTDSTRGMIGKAELAQMKKGAILINTARGAVCDEEALTRAIEEGHLGGLGVDVFSAEPFLAEHPFTRIMGRENVCLTPHMAWGAVESRNRCLATVAENIKAYFAGDMQNRVDRME